jgi:hypothetical protein
MRREETRLISQHPKKEHSRQSIRLCISEEKGGETWLISYPTINARTAAVRFDSIPPFRN